MAYRHPDQNFNRINYFSNPNVSIKLDVNGKLWKKGNGKYIEYPTGSHEEDNARVITTTRFAFAAIGDESEECNNGKTASKPDDFCTDKRDTGRCASLAARGLCHNSQWEDDMSDKCRKVSVIEET